MIFKLKQLAKDSFIYGFGDILGKGVLFLLLPVYTWIFAPAEYGVIETLTMLNTFLSIFLIMGMDGAQSFYFFEQKNRGKNEQINVVTAVVQWRLAWGSVFVILATLLSPVLNHFLFKGGLTLAYFAVAFVGALFAQLVGQSAEVFRLLHRPLKYIVVTLSYVIISSALSIVLVVNFGLGIKGYFTGILLSGCIVVIFGFWLIRDYLDFIKLHIAWWPKLIKFGSPFILNGLFMYGLLTADRWFIVHYHGPAALGLYAVGAKFVIFILVAVNAFRTAWWPIAMDVLQSPDGSLLFKTVARLYLGLGAICVVALTFLSPILIRIFVSREYYFVYPIVGILSWYAVFYGFYLIVCAGIWKNEKTILASLAIGIAVLVDIILNLCLVPKFSGPGAAVATSVSFFVWVLVTFLISEKIWPIHLPLWVLGLQIGIGVASCWSILYIYQNSLPVNQAGIIAFIAAALLACTLLKFAQYKKIYKNIKLKIFSIA